MTPDERTALVKKGHFFALRRAEASSPAPTTTKLHKVSDCKTSASENGGQAHGAVLPTDEAENAIQSSETSFDLWLETKLLFDVAAPTVVVQFSMLFIFPLTTSAVGLQLGTEELAGFSLASLAGSLLFLSLIVGTLTASETLQPRAFGSADYEEVGRLAIRGVVACSLVLLPILLPVLSFMESIMLFLGQDPTAAALSSKWIRFYALGLPAALLFRSMQRFLAAQGIVMPMVYSSVVGCIILHPIFLHYFIPLFGFDGSGLAIVCTQMAMVVIAFAILSRTKPYHPQTWPGLSFTFVMEALQTKPLLQFLYLGFGGILTFSEWWFWEMVCFIAGRFGIVSFCVNSIAYSVVPTFFMVPLGISIGLCVRIGTILGQDVKRAKLVTIYGLGFATLLVFAMTVTLYLCRVFVARLYTHDEEVLEGCEKIWWKMCVYLFFLSTSGVNGGIARALGVQWKMAGILATVLWCLSLPVIYVTAVSQDGGLDAIWTVLPITYLVVNAALIFSYVTTDWSAVGAMIRERARRGANT